MRVKNFLLLTVAVFVLAWIFLPAGGQGYDVSCFQRWTLFIQTHGLGHAYELKGLDYNPLYLELLWIYGRIEDVQVVEGAFFTFKLLVLLFDFAAVYLTAYLLKRNGRNIALACFVLFNLAYLFNTLIWGQVDSIFTTCIAFSIFLATQKKILASLLFVQLALNFKLPALVFVPLILLLNLPEIIRDRKTFLWALLVASLVQVAILSPFLDAHKLRAIVAANQTQLRVSSALSPSGYNLWYLIAGATASSVQASTTFLHIAAKTWGVLLFGLSAAAILFPLFRETVIEKKELSHAYVFRACALYALAFFFFTTGMHERYSHPAILLLGIAAVLSGGYFKYLCASLAYFLNLQKGYAFFHTDSWNTLIFQPRSIATLFLIVLVVGVVQIYWQRAPVLRRA